METVLSIKLFYVYVSMLEAFELNITVEYDESFDHEVEDVEDVEQAREQAKDFGEMVIRDDIQMGDIPVDAFDITVEAERIED